MGRRRTGGLVGMGLVLLGGAPVALADPPRWEDGWEVSFEVGGEFDLRPHGILNAGVRRGPLSLRLITDTLDVRYAPETDRWRAWVAARAQLGAAGLLITRWDGGRPVAGENLLAFREAVEGGAVAYLPHGLYAGGQAAASWWHFAALPATTRSVPSGRPVLTAEALLGWYHPWVHVWMRAGTDWSRRWSPHVHGTLTTSLPWLVRPRVEVRAGWAEDTDEVLATRLGGLNPYVVPLAGAAWAEFLVEDHLALRGAVAVGRDDGALDWSAFAGADLAVFQGREEVGFVVGGRVDHRGRWVELAWGYAPWLPRPGSLAMAGLVRVGLDWGKGFGPRGPAPSER